MKVKAAAAGLGEAAIKGLQQHPKDINTEAFNRPLDVSDILPSSSLRDESGIRRVIYRRKLTGLPPASPEIICRWMSVCTYSHGVYDNIPVF